MADIQKEVDILEKRLANLKAALDSEEFQISFIKEKELAKEAERLKRQR